MVRKSVDFVKYYRRFEISTEVFFPTHNYFLQVIASTVKNFLLLDLGLSIAFPTIVIPALMGLNNALNPDETVHLTAVQASWLGTC